MKIVDFLFIISWQVVFVTCYGQMTSIGTRPECREKPCSLLLSQSRGQNSADCYSFQASNGTLFCSTVLPCEVLHPCDENKQCPSKKLICVVDSCCSEPVCMPLVTARHLCPASEYGLQVKVEAVKLPATKRNRTRKDVTIRKGRMFPNQPTEPTPPMEPTPPTPPTPPMEPTPPTPPTPPMEPTPPTLPTPPTPPIELTPPTPPTVVARCTKKEVHVIGIYEAATNHFGGSHPVKAVTVTLQRTGDQVLVLSSYEPIRWNIKLAKDVRLHAIHLIGFYKQTVVPITGHRNIKMTKDIGTSVACGYAWPYNGGGCDTNELLKLAQRRAGNNITSFHGCYRASVWKIDTNAQATSNCAVQQGNQQYSYYPPCQSTIAWQHFSFTTSDQASCSGMRYVRFNKKYNLWVGAILCGSNDRYKLYLSRAKKGAFLQIADYAGYGEDHCELVNPTFSIPNNDDITSGGCATCALGGLVDVQNTNVYARGYYGEQFERVRSGFWGDLTTTWYQCGVAIP